MARWWLWGAWACTSEPEVAKDRGQVDSARPTSVDSASTASPTETGEGLPPRGSLERLALEVERSGFERRLGALEFGVEDDCCAWPSCLHTNPEGEYGLVALPAAPGVEASDRSPDAEGRSLSWRLRPDEVVLWLGPPPGPAGYRSLRSYVNDVANPDGTRTLAFLSLGDSLNDRVWTLDPEGRLLVALVADAAAASLVAEAFTAAGLGPLHQDVVPADRARLGADLAADALRWTFRLADRDPTVAFDPSAAAAGVEIWRLTPREPLAGAPLLAPPPRRARAVAPPAGADEAFSALRDALLDAFGDRPVQEAVLDANEPPADGSCWEGCNRDVTYAGTPVVPLGPEDGLVVYGWNPVAAGQAVYAAAVAYGSRNDDPAGFVDSRGFVGSARVFLPAHPLADQLYVGLFARDCSLLPAAWRAVCAPLAAGCPGLDPDEAVSVTWRHYLDPVSGAYPPLSGLGPRGALRFGPEAPP